MNLPTSVRVGYRDFQIVDWDEKAASAAGRLGECDLQHGIIRVCQAYGMQSGCNTLIHEVLHAAYASARLGNKEPEERVVSCLADQLSQIWRDNPGLVTFVSWASMGAR